MTHIARAVEPFASMATAHGKQSSHASIARIDRSSPDKSRPRCASAAAEHQVEGGGVRACAKRSGRNLRSAASSRFLQAGAAGGLWRLRTGFCRSRRPDHRNGGRLCVHGLGLRPAVGASVDGRPVPAEAQDEAWGSNPDATFCGSYAPVNEARAAHGGYRLNGRWSFASGCDNAQWAICAARLPATSERPGSAGVPAGPGERLCDRRHLGCHRACRHGKQDAGSERCVRTRTSHRCCSPTQRPGARPAASSTPIGSTRCRSTLISRLPRRDGGRRGGGCGRGFHRRHQRAPDARLGDRRQQSHGRIPDRSNSRGRGRLRRSTQRGRSCFAIWRRSLARCGKNGEGSIQQRVINRRGQAFAVNLAVRSVDILNAATGGNGLALSNPIQRAWRDVNAVARHVSVNWDVLAQCTDRWRLGSSRVANIRPPGLRAVRIQGRSGRRSKRPVG